MFIETLEFTIPVELCNVFSTLQKGQRSNVEFPASVNSYGTTQDASVQVVLRSNKLTFKVDGVSSNASMISKSECKTLKLSVFDVDRTLMPQENDNYDSNNMSAMQHSTPVSFPSKRHQEISVSQPPAKNRRTSFSESPRPRSPLHRRSQPQISPRPSQNTQSKSKNDSPVNVKQEPEDPDLIEIELDHDPDDVVPKKETPYMQIDYSSDVPHTQTSQAALDRLSHPQSSHSQSPGSSSSSFHQNVPHVPDYAEPSTSQVHHGDQSADDFLVFQEQDEDCDDNDADYGNDVAGHSFKYHNFMLKRLCRICGKLADGGPKKIKFLPELLELFHVNVLTDVPDVHPLKICLAHKQVLNRFKRAKMSGRPYSTHAVPLEFVPYEEIHTDCFVCFPFYG
ncbi:uncharacterized protein LOC124128726 isoform X29 [Haliotis rufescens]|uniref:uncharacterized protein LOC124128726 isoform X29 n=1 Tax=Haliotis rufescens TaxID=6454 RepID=UPI00201F9F22|nr:uncharacterized protein LOC124128726 isoform X29 [Haliotis rufescens]